MEFVLLALAVATIAVIIASKKKDKISTKTDYVSVNPKDLDEEELKKRPKL